MSLRTPLCDLLGIAHPILQSGMGNVAGPELVAEVTRAGGLGILAGLSVPPDELRRRIRRVRELTAGPFGVNLWLHSALRPPVDAATIPAETLAAVQAVLNGFRARLGLAPTAARPATLPDLVDAGLEVILDERPAVFSTGLGTLDAAAVERFHARGTRVVSMVTSVADARRAAAIGVDVVVAQGSEAGGHRSVGVKEEAAGAPGVGTLALVPQVVDAVRVPVVAAGGIADGRGLVAALALGAAGVLLGTRFVATRESSVPEFHKKALLESDGDATVLTDVISGLHARVLRCAYATEYAATGAPVLPPLLQTAAAQDIFRQAAQQQDRAHYPIMAGQSVGLVHDLPGAAEVVAAVVREAETVLAALPGRGR